MRNNEYRYSPNGDGSYTVTLYTDLEFNDFPKRDTMAACKNFLEDVDEENGFADCNADGGLVEKVQPKTAKPLSDEMLDNMEKGCEENLNAYAKDYDNDDDNKGGENQSNPSGDVTPEDQGGKSTSTFGNDDFVCNVTTKDGKIYQHMTMTTLGVAMTTESEYAMLDNEGWYVTINYVLEGSLASTMAKEMCEEFEEEYDGYDQIETGLTCGDTSVQLVQCLG